MRLNRRTGMTLVEVMVATGVAAVASISFMGSVVFCLRQNAANRVHLNAVLLATEHQGLLRAADPNRVGSTDLSEDEFEQRFAWTSDSPLVIEVGGSSIGPPESYEVFFRFSGWGPVLEATEHTLSATIAENQDSWAEDEWSGSYVTIVAGRGKGQIMRIVSNDADTLTVTSDLRQGTLSETTGWDILPNETSRFCINNSRTVRVHVRWGNGQNHRSIVRTVLLRQG